MCVFSLLVAELVTGGCLPRSDTPAGLQQGDKGRKPQLHLSLWVFYTLCRWVLFRGLRTVEGSPYFTNLLDIAFELYVLLTTANSPDVMYVSHPFTATDACYITECTFLKATVGEKIGEFLFVHICFKIFIVFFWGATP